MNTTYLLLGISCAAPLVLWVVLKRPLWLWYTLIFILLEPSRYLSLSSISLGYFSFKAYELLLPLIYLASFIHRKRPLRECIKPALSLFFLCTLISLFHGLNAGYGVSAFNYFRPFFSIGIAICVPLFFDNSEDLFKVGRFFVITATFFILIELISLETNLGYNFVYSPLRAKYHTLMSDTSCTNMAFIFIFIFAMFDISMPHAWVYFLLLAFSLLCTIVSSARAVWVGMLVSLTGFFVLARARTKVYLTFFVMVGIILLFLLSSMYIARYDMTLAERIPLFLSSDEGNARWRLMAWHQTIEDISQHPLIGWPMGAEPLFYVENSGVFNSSAAHNEYLKIARYTGIPGILFFLIYCFSLSWRSVVSLFQITGKQRQKTLALFLCFVFIMVTSAFSQRITSLDICPFIWGNVGALELSLLQNKKSGSQVSLEGAS